MCEADNFVSKFRPEEVKCAQIFCAHIVWLNLLNILKQEKFRKSVCMKPIFELEKAPKTDFSGSPWVKSKFYSHHFASILFQFEKFDYVWDAGLGAEFTPTPTDKYRFRLERRATIERIV